jgi:hypothetical protein
MVGETGMSPADDLQGAQQIAARIAARTEIRDVRLMKSSAEIMRIPADNPFLAYDLASKAIVEHDAGSGSFVVRGTYRLSIRTAPSSIAESDSPRETSDIAKVEFEQAALFVIEMDGADPPSDEELNAYAVTTGQFALYPYVREYISDITCRLGLPALTVGVLRMPAPGPGV